MLTKNAIFLLCICVPLFIVAPYSIASDSPESQIKPNATCTNVEQTLAVRVTGNFDYNSSEFAISSGVCLEIILINDTPLFHDFVVNSSTEFPDGISIEATASTTTTKTFQIPVFTSYYYSQFLLFSSWA